MPTDTLTCQVTPDSVEPTSLSCSMPPLEWLDLWTSIGSLATAVATIALVIAAIWAGSIAVSTLRQMKADSIAQTRPYVYVHLVPSIGGVAAWDLVVKNSGRSSARQLTLTTNDWPNRNDDVLGPLKVMFGAEQIVPPNVSIRSLWRTDTPDGTTTTKGKPVMGMPRTSSVTVRYHGDTDAWYSDTYAFSSETIGLTPVPASGPEPHEDMTPVERNFQIMLSRIAQNIGELGRNG